MSKFLPQKKKLLEEVFEKASRNTPETSFSGILLYLEQILKDDFEALSYKAFENYYKTIVEKDEDYNIKTSILDNLSRYLEFDSFRDYCSGWKSFEYQINQALSKLVITVVNKPIFAMPQLTKQSSLGILGILLFCGFWAGNKMIGEPKEITENENAVQTSEKIESETTVPVGFANLNLKTEAQQDLPKETIPLAYKKKKECMYWNGIEYKAAFCDENDSQHESIAIREFALRNLKKITRTDTLTPENAIGKVWYDKSNNNVEFFTSYGKHPENGKALRDVTERILKNYAGIQKE